MMDIFFNILPLYLNQDKITTIPSLVAGSNFVCTSFWALVFYVGIIGFDKSNISDSGVEGEIFLYKRCQSLALNPILTVI